MGLVDDASVIAAAVFKIIQHIDDDVKNKAKQQLVKVFGDDGDYGDIDKRLLR